MCCAEEVKIKINFQKKKLIVVYNKCVFWTSTRTMVRMAKGWQSGNMNDNNVN